MPISALQRERLQRCLSGYEAALRRSDRPLTAVAATVHRILLELGRNDAILALVNDFVDSPQLADTLRDDGASALRARGIDLPEGVTMKVVDGYGDEPKPILRFVVTVRNVSVLADWDPTLGVSAQLERVPLNG